MRRVLPLLLAALPVAVALDAAAADPATEGHRLFVQSCGVCHLKPNLKAGLYGPALTRETVGGKESAVRELVQTGTPRMPTQWIQGHGILKITHATGSRRGRRPPDRFAPNGADLRYGGRTQRQI